jgi:hypothetical protein
MTRSATFGQWTFYGILSIVILFISQTHIQVNGVGMDEFENTYETFTQQMAIFKRRTSVIRVNEDPDQGMLNVVCNNLDRIRQILKAFEPISGVVNAPGIKIVAYRQTIHELTVLLWFHQWGRHSTHPNESHTKYRHKIFIFKDGNSTMNVTIAF